MIKSQVIEASSFTQSRCTFNIPEKLCSSLKLCHLGVFGANCYLLDGVIGQLAVIKKITLHNGGTVLSQYDRNFNNFMEYKALNSSNTKNRQINKALYSSNFGTVLNNGGTNAANPVAGVAVGESAQIRPRICIDKKNLKSSATLEVNSDLAILDLATILGFLNATYSNDSMSVSSVIPFHLFTNLKLTVEFNTAASVASDNAPPPNTINATTIAQPYLIFDEVVDQQLEEKLMSAKSSLVATYTDLELESVNLLQTLTSKSFLNGFYGKTLGNLIMMVSTNGDARLSPLSQYQTAEQVNIIVNNTNLIQLTSGIDHVGKKACFTRMLGMDLSIVGMADRIVGTIVGYAGDANAEVAGLYEGGANSANVESNYYTSGSQSYLVLPIQAKISTLQIDYTRTANASSTLLFWGEVGKMMSFDKMGATNVSYL